jgi:hypothetical protein
MTEISNTYRILLGKTLGMRPLEDREGNVDNVMMVLKEI